VIKSTDNIYVAGVSVERCVLYFVLHNVYRMDEYTFKWMLRAHLYGYEMSTDPNNFTGGEDGEQSAVMHFTLKMGPISLLKTLLEWGQGCDWEDYKGRTPLLIALSDNRKIEYVKLLLLYGADINKYDMNFNTTYQQAVGVSNVAGLRLLLERRLVNKLAFPGGPDVFQMPDANYETPLTSAVDPQPSKLRYRKEIVNLLVDAGADGDYVSRGAFSTIDPAKNPYFIGNLDSNADSSLAVGFMDSRVENGVWDSFITIRKEGLTGCVVLSMAELRSFVDMGASVLPTTGFRLLRFLANIRHQRFRCDATLQGADFDLHFLQDMTPDGQFIHSWSVVDPTRFSIKLAPYKMAVRFPKGPVQKPLVGQPVIRLDKGHTVAHYAALANEPEDVMPVAVTMCNPLRTCANGFTPVETLRARLHNSRVMSRAL
jgi:hypothetical protein